MKRVNNNYQCANVSTETYTGKEQSPKGMGFSAVGYEVGFEKEGVDKLLWVVQMKNNKKVWFRKNGMPKVSHEEPLITDTCNSTDTNISSLTSITSITSISDIKNENPDNNDNEETKEIINTETQVTKKETVSKKTDFNIFYKYHSNKLKEENKEKGLNKKPKEIQEETYSEWNRIKKNKDELNELLLLINNKA